MTNHSVEPPAINIWQGRRIDISCPSQLRKFWAKKKTILLIESSLTLS